MMLRLLLKDSVLIFLMSLLTTMVWGQEQIGNDILGESGSRSGWSVAMNHQGNIVVVGLPTVTPIDSPKRSMFREYKRSGNSWSLVGNTQSLFMNNDGGTLESTNVRGTAVAVSDDGTVVAFSAPFNDSNHTNGGAVRVYKWTGSAWIARGQPIFGAGDGDYFGTSLDISAGGDTLIVSSPYYDDGSSTDVGLLQTYVWDGNAWTILTTANGLEGEASGDRFGWSLALSEDGQTMAVGAYHNDNNGVPNAGAVYVYKMALSGGNIVWLPNDTLYGVVNGSNNVDFGYAVALSNDGNTVVVGCSYGDISGNDNKGTIEIFHYDGSQWTQVGQTLQGTEADEHFGISVAISGDGNRIAGGSIGYDTSGATNIGAVRVFEDTGNYWQQIGEYFQGPQEHSDFGYSVAMDGHGCLFVAAAPYYDIGGASDNQGMTQVYSLMNQPQATANTPVCAGSVLRFEETTGGFESYSWVGPNFNADVQNPVLDAPALSNSGTYTVTTKDDNGCSKEASVSVIVDMLNGIATTTSSDTILQQGNDSIVYTNDNCEIISTVKSHYDLGTVIAQLITTPASVIYDANSAPYIGLHYEITPSQNVDKPAKITVFFSDADVAAYNTVIAALNNPNFPTINMNSVDHSHWIKITAFHGLPSSGTTGPNGLYDLSNKDLLAPTSIVHANGVYTVTFNSPNGFSGFFAHTTINHPLPLLFGGLTAKNDGTVNHLYWKTYDDDVANYFVIQRSQDGKSFENIGRVEGKFHVAEYRYKDFMPLTGNNYYRVVMVNRNGQKSYSRIASATVAKNGFIFEVYPNPVNGRLKIKLLNNVRTRSELTIVDMTGRVLEKIKMPQNEMSIDMTNFAGGVYFVKYIDDAHAATVKVNKL